MRLLIVAMIASFLLRPDVALADDSSVGMLTERIKPCDWWSYSAAVSGYVCRNNPWYIEVPTAREVQRVVNDLSQKIQELEMRIEALENGEK